jgi:hypothetical protein
MGRARRATLWMGQLSRVWTHNLDPVERSEKSGRSEEISDEPVIACGDVSPILNAKEKSFSIFWRRRKIASVNMLQ